MRMPMALAIPSAMFNAVTAAALLAMLAGCGTLTAPNYQAKIANTQSLMPLSPARVATGEFTAGDDKAAHVNRLALRANSFVSPYQNSFVEYLREATRIELEQAGLYDAASALKIEGQLQVNTLNISSASTGTASAQARFILKKLETVHYDKVLRVTHEWASSFIGAIAIPAGAQNYGAMIQKLLGALFADEDFKKGIEQSRL